MESVTDTTQQHITCPWFETDIPPTSTELDLFNVKINTLLTGLQCFMLERQLLQMACQSSIGNPSRLSVLILNTQTQTFQQIRENNWKAKLPKVTLIASEDRFDRHSHTREFATKIWIGRSIKSYIADVKNIYRFVKAISIFISWW